MLATGSIEVDSTKRQATRFLGRLQVLSQLSFVLFGHAHEADAVAEIGVAGDDLAASADFHVVQLQHDVNARRGLQCLQHFDVTAAFADVGGLTAAGKILEQMPCLGGH